MRSLLVTLLLLCGCTKNHQELKARVDQLDRRLAERMALASNLDDYRKENAALEAELKSELDAHPEALAVADGVALEPVAVPAPTSPLPKESFLEGAEGARLRARISDNQRRLAELDKLIGEDSKLTARRRRIEKQLRAVRSLSAK